MEPHRQHQKLIRFVELSVGIVDIGDEAQEAFP